MSWLKGLISRAMPQAGIDTQPAVVRLWRYGEASIIPVIRKQHALANEGSYFVANNAQTAIATGLLGTTFSQTTVSPVLVITNNDSPTNSNARRIDLDYVHVSVTTAGTGTTVTNLNFAWSTDTLDRYSSGGTDLSSPAAGGGIFNVNCDVPARQSNARIRFGGLTLNAASGNARIIIPQRQLRQLNSATVAGAVQDVFYFNFGNVEPNHGPQTDISGAKTTAGTWTFMIPAITIGANQCAILHLWSPGQILTGAISFILEMGWWER